MPAINISFTNPPEEHLDTQYLRSLLRLSKKLELAHDYPSIIRALTWEIEHMIGYHAAWAYLFTDEPNKIILLSAQEDVGIAENVPVLDTSNDPFLQEIAEANHIVIVEDASTDPRTNKEIVAQLGNQTIINVPVHLAGKKIATIGTGSFGDEGVHVPSDEQLNFLSALSSHVAVALDRVRLYQDRLAADAEKLEVQEQLAHTQRLESLGVLAGGIAHDFNNILTSILGNAALAENQLDEKRVAHEHLKRITSASERAADLCKQMLAYAGHRNLQSTVINLSALIQEMASLLEVSIGKAIRLEYDLQDGLPSILGDAGKIQQVMMNLITNANEAIGDNLGCIRISTGQIHANSAYLESLTHAQNAQEGDYITFEVTDDGCGMDANTLEKLFDPFYTTKATGRGLGMSAVLGIIKSHHGALTLDTKLGVGSSFKVLFPATQEEETPQESTDSVNISRFKDATVLVIDDEAMVRDITALILENMGFKTLSAESGKQALELLQQNVDKIDLALLDMTMPDMDGVETLNQIRQINNDLPVIIVSGYSQQDTTNRFAEQQPSGFLDKPFLPEKLENMLFKVLSKSKAK